MNLKRFLFLVALSFMMLPLGYSQITTSSMSGTITDGDSQPIFGATVTAVHQPSGTFYGVTTQENGKYNIPHMRVGGPYLIEVSYLGYQVEPVENLHLALGQKLNLGFQMQEEGVLVDQLTIVGTLDQVLNGERTGAATAVSRNQIDRLPTISRSADDYTRLNPMSARGGSFGGRNDQYNGYSLNGAIFNNPFGLDSATPGGQTDAQPVSLDAIDQISVQIAPYDVTQSGFTGASINAVTKSGTNEFHGSLYGYFRNNSMSGSKVRGVEALQGDVSNSQFGFGVGGPIIKNKLFFFVNFEREDRSDLASSFIPSVNGSTGANVSRVTAEDMNRVKNLLMDKYGYDSGAITGFKHEAPNTKGLLKLDYNVNKNHSLSYTFNFLDAFKDKSGHPSAVGRRGPDFLTLQMENSGYTINNKISSHLLELKSILGASLSNKLQVGLTKFDDSRDPFSEPFPTVNINKDGQRYIIAGHEPFSVHNRLKQDVFQINDNLNIYSGNHTFTVGAALEKFSFDNSFNLGTFPGVFGHIPIPGTFFTRDFSSVDEFEQWVNDGNFDAAVETSKNLFNQYGGDNGGEGIDTDTSGGYQGWALAETNLGQISFYLQDEYQVNDRLTVTGGVRFDKPTYFDTKDKIEENLTRNGAYIPTIEYYEEDGTPITLIQTDLPDADLLINPRIGFNYDISGDRTKQLRGGTGLFSGRFPFVWFGNQVANPNFFFYTTTAKDFKFPQVWKTNIGYDHKMSNGWTGTIDLLYTKDINASMVRNYGLKPPTGTLGGVDGRPIYLAADRNGFGNNAYVFSGTDVGYSFNASLQMQRSWGNNFAMIGYNYLKAEDASSIDAEISSDAYARNPGNIAHVNTPLSAPSSYGNTHRIILAASRKFEYANNMATTVSIFAESASGTRYSYTYGGDINNDGSGLNDLLYVPTDSELAAMNFASDDQRAAFGAYIEQDDYLSSRRGEYAEKYGAESPWFTQLDLRILQDLAFKGKKIQLSFDIKNFANMISSDWGVLQTASQTGLAQVVGVSVDSDTSIPTYSFDTAQKQTFFDDFSLASRWQMQLGLRFIF